MFTMSTPSSTIQTLTAWEYSTLQFSQIYSSLIDEKFGEIVGYNCGL